MVVQGAGSHLTQRLGLASRVLRSHERLNGCAAQLLTRVSEEIAEALIHAQPLAVEVQCTIPTGAASNVER